jgi:multiple sugar transport system substrate-binding protein
MHVTSRRGFLKIAAAGAAGAALSPALGRAAGKTVTLLHESSFIPPFDEYMKNVLAPAYEKETGVKIVYEIISVGSSPARIASISETGTGADITMNLTLIPFLYDEKYADVGDIAEEMGKEQGGWYPAAREMAIVNGKWKAIPFCSIGQLMNWRSDWFAEVGFKEFPGTWDELYEAGKKLKTKGHPFGFELGHGFGDNHGWLYPLLWSYGAHEVAEDGKTVTIDSDETARAVDFARKFFQDTMFEDVLGWTDPSNNKAWMAEQISCTNNAESILWFAKQNFPEIGEVTQQSLNPAGPKGRFHFLGGSAIRSSISPRRRKKRTTSCVGYRNRSSWAPGMTLRSAIISRCCTPTTTRLCGMSSHATSPTAMRSAPVICRAGRRPPTAGWPRVSRNTWSWTCSPKRAPAPRPRR